MPQHAPGCARTRAAPTAMRFPRPPPPPPLPPLHRVRVRLRLRLRLRLRRSACRLLTCGLTRPLSRSPCGLLSYNEPTAATATAQFPRGAVPPGTRCVYPGPPLGSGVARRPGRCGSAMPCGPVSWSGGCSSGTSAPSASRSGYPFRNAEVYAVDWCFMVDRRYSRTGKQPLSPNPPRKWCGRDGRGDPGAGGTGGAIRAREGRAGRQAGIPGVAPSGLLATG
jgi:hypothetical protein